MTTTTSRKRVHPGDKSTPPPRLSVVEFCSVLNGSSNNPHDAQDLLRILQRFVRVVRSERRAALRDRSVVEEDEDDDDGDDGDYHVDDLNEDHEEPLTAMEEGDTTSKSTTPTTSKRFKKDESWKEDTKSYQVPFVGTSQATTIRQQDYGQVVEQTWPCGLLQAYLIKSPMMRELLVFDDVSSSSSSSNSFLPRHILRRIPPRPNTITSSSTNSTTSSSSSKQNDKKKHQHFSKWQSQLLKAYLQALKEVITAILPAKEYTTTLSDPMQQRLLTLFQNQVMPVVWHVVEQPSSQPQQQASSSSSSSDAAFQSACVPIAMQMLVRMASVSVASARQVAQHLATTTKLQVQASWFSLPSVHPTTATATDASKLLQDSTTKAITTAEPSDQVEVDAEVPSASSKDKKGKTITKPHQTNSKQLSFLWHQQTCRGALRLVTTLCEWNEPGLTATIMSAGAKERKLPPGLLYTALRATRLWKSVANNMPSESTESTSDTPVTLPSTGFVNVSLGRLLKSLRRALQAGVLKRRQRLWMDLWSGGDAWQNLIQLAALTPVSSWNQDQNVEMDQSSPVDCSSSREAGRLLTVFLTQSQDSPMLLALNTNSGVGGADDNDALLIQTKNNASQQLIRALIYLLDHRPLFGRHELMTLHAFVLQCLQTTPALVQPFFRALTIPELTKPFALIARWHLISKYLTTTMGESQPKVAWSDKLKHVLSKALQSSNAMLVAETLKLILNLLHCHDRSNKTQNHAADRLPRSNSNKQLDSNSFFELQVLLSVRSRWNPFTGKKATPDMLIIIHLCQVLDAVAKMWPHLLTASKYDWMKLLPPTAAAFTQSHPLLQMRLLRTLQTMMELQLDHETSARFTPSSIRIVLEIMIETRSKFAQVSSAATQVVLLRFRRLLFNASSISDDNDPETLEVCACVEYEWKCWLEGVTSDSLSAFLTIVDHAATKKSSHVISAALAWEKTGLPGSLTNLSVSPILLTALLEQQNANSTVAHLTFQVATRCLLYHRFPLPLAAIVSSKDWGEDIEEKGRLPLLSQYAKSLVDFDGENESKRNTLRQSLVALVFEGETAQMPPWTGSAAAAHWNGFAKKNGSEVAMRLLLHLFLCAKDEAEHHSIREVLQSLVLPVVAQKKHDAGQVKPLLYYLYDALGGCDTMFFDLALLSCPASSTIHSLLENIVPSIASSLPLNDHGAALSSTIKRHVLLNGSWRDVLPLASAARAQEYLIQAVTEEKANPPSLFSKLLLVWLSDNASSVSIPLNVAFRAWCNLCNRGSKQGLSWQIARQLESVICRQVARDSLGVVSTQLYALLQRESLEAIIDNCLRSKHALNSETTYDEGSCLLTLILKLDICGIMPVFFHKLSDANSSTIVTELFCRTALDCALMLAAEHLELLEATTRENLAQKMINKAKDSFSRNKEQLSHGERSALIIVTRCMEYEIGTLGMLVSWAELVLSLIGRLGEQDEPTRIVILNATSCASLKFESFQGDDSYESTKRHWVSSVFITLCDELPKVLRSLRRGDKEGQVGPSAALKHLSVLQVILKTRDEPGLQRDEATTVCLGKVLRSCLKHGITDDPTACAVTSSCLKLARLAFVATEKIRLSGFVVRVPFLSAPTVFRMIVTHSKFHAALELQENDQTANNPPKRELILLLLCCVSIARGEITFDESLVKVLSSTFNAGVSALDATIRRLIYVYTQSVAERPETFRISADEFRWTKELAGSGADVSNPVTQMDQWEWLLNSLDADRLRETLQLFPTSDSLYPEPQEEESEWRSRPDVSTADINVPSDHAYDQESWIRDNDRDGRDGRYSPGFVLPTILACLEGIFPGDDQLTERVLTESVEEESSQQETERDSLHEETRAFVMTVKRLCDLGVLSFTLGALCSTCPLVRKVAVGILSIILKTLRSREAADLLEWRERPQLQMLVNSVQRSLVVRKAAQKEDTSFDSNEVRRLPSVASIFLARAAAVVSKPGDAMFAPINRFFLKVDVEHGAFQDLTRLPAFISLFCSSSEEPPGQSQRERVWALRLLEEGFLDESCYRLVTACHAPALLQTFLITIRPSDREKDGKVNTLIIRALNRFLMDGGQNARTHLIGRMGLLSWLRCLLSGASTFSKDCICDLFLLIQSSMQGALDMAKTDSKSLLLEVIGLARPFIDIAAISFGSTSTTTADGEVNSGDVQLVTSTRKLLRLLKLAMESAYQGDLSIRQDGASLQSATAVLRGTGLDSDVLLAVCTLPFHVDKSAMSAAENFCNMAMMAILDKRESIASEDIAVVMNRTSIILQSFMWPEPRPLLKTLISCRDICFRNPKGKLAWMQCIAGLAPGAEIFELAFAPQ